jgi:phosphatidylinositol dimannoside acyltransferase
VAGGAHRGERLVIAAALSRAAERAVPALPGALDIPVSEIVGTLGWLASPGRRAAVRSNLSVIAPARGDLSRRVFVCQARHYVETFRILRLEPARLIDMVDLEGWGPLTQALARGKGVVLASAHLGPVVLCGQVLAARGLDVSVTVEAKTGDIGRVIDRARGAMGIKTIETRSPMAIGRVLRRGAVLGTLADRPVSGVGERVTFFGRETLLPSAHIALALHTGAALLPAFALREGGRLHAVMGPELELARTGDRAVDLRDGVQRWAAILESWVARAPEQWSVFERVWG